jgi:hypothetical protein
VLKKERSTEVQVTEALAVVQRQVDAVRLPKRITDDNVYRIVAEGRQTLKRALDTMEAERKRLVDPLNKAVKHINAMAKPVTDHIRSRIVDVDNLLNIYETAKQAKALKAAKKVATKAEAAGVPEAVVASIVTKAREEAIPVVQGMTHRVVVRGQVDDLKALCAAVAKGEAPESIFEVRQTVLNALAKSGQPMPAGTSRHEESIRVAVGVSA